jgi:hypothetical protein
MTVVQAIEGFKPGPHNAVLSPKNQVSVQANPENEREMMCLMRTKFNEERSTDGPYFVDIECAARFSIRDVKLSQDEAKRGVLITGHNVAYGAIREAVNWITSRHVNGPLVLGLSVLQFKKEPASPAVTASEPSPQE